MWYYWEKQPNEIGGSRGILRSIDSKSMHVEAFCQVTGEDEVTHALDTNVDWETIRVATDEEISYFMTQVALKML